MDAFVAVGANRDQFEEEFVPEVGVGQVMDLGRRPRATALTDPFVAPQRLGALVSPGL